MERAAARVVDVRAGQVAGHQVWRELDALEMRLQAAGQSFDGRGLGQAGKALDQDMPARQQADDQAVEQARLADDDA
jgi:hypothetical protein